MDDIALVVEPARTEEIPQVFQALYAHLDEPQRAYHVNRLLALLEAADLRPEGILVARRGPRVEGAMLCTYGAGAAGFVWLPRIFETDDFQRTEDALVQAAHGALRRGGCKLSQSVLSVREHEAAKVLLRNGFRYVTRMHWLKRDLNDWYAEPLILPKGLSMHLPTHELQSLFEQTLLRSYESSTDFPELNGLRSVAEILAGHHGPEGDDPDAWWLACENGEPVAVLLLADLGDQGRWELSYLGVVPQARGRGLGKILTRFAQDHVRSAGGRQLTVTVDERNHIARQLYLAAGFVPYDQRDIFLCIY